jgi:hypothetical protein
MTRRFWPAFLAGLWLSLPGLCRAQQAAESPPGPPKTLPDKAPPPPTEAPPCGPTLEKTIHGVNVFLQEVQKAITVPNLTLRDVVSPPCKRPSIKLDWREEKHPVTEIVMKPHEVEQEVVCTKTEKVTTIDPCTGKPCTVFKEVPYVKKVKITEFEAVPVQRQIVVRIPVLKPVEEEIRIKTLAVDHTREAAIRKELRAITIPWEVHVQVPVGLPPLPLPPCPPPCAPPCLPTEGFP